MFVVLKKKSLSAAVLAVLISTLLIFALTAGSAAEVFYGATKRKIPVYGVETDKKVVALTFDAAWGADKTRDIISLLKEYGAEGTFFLVGFWIDAYPEETKFIADSGLDIGNHSNNHLDMTKLSAEQNAKEIAEVNDRIYRLTGKMSQYFRPPFGAYNNNLITAVENAGLTTVQWSVDSLDWKGLSGAEIAERVLARAHNGAIILFHNNSDHILDALPLILVGLQNKGYSFVKLSELVATENYYVDNNGTQHKNIN